MILNFFCKLIKTSRMITALLISPFIVPLSHFCCKMKYISVYPVPRIIAVK